MRLPSFFRHAGISPRLRPIPRISGLEVVPMLLTAMLPAVMLLTAMLLTAMLLGGCGTDSASSADTQSQDAGLDAGETDATADTQNADTGPKLTVKWTQLLPDSNAKMRAVAPVPGKPGSYVIVGEQATVLRLDGAVFTDISPKTVGKVDLNAVWVDADGTIVAAGAGSTLITHDGAGWQVAGSVPPAPPVTFLAVHGVADAAGKGVVWAVGERGQAYKRAGAVWTAATVTITAAGVEAIGAQADFVDVQVAKSGRVLIAVSKGQKSAGLLLRTMDAKTWTSTGLPTSPRAVWADLGDDQQSGGTIMVGGTTSTYVVTWNGKSFVDTGDVQWSLGFRAVNGLDPKQVWIGGLKGQVRSWDGKAWSVVNIAPPPGTLDGFPTPSNDILAIGSHSADELLVLTAFKLYRRGKQP